jgi:Chaperone of endosialidase
MKLKNFTLKIIFIFLFCFILQGTTFAQLGVNSTGTAPAASAMLDISSTSKGFLMPRMTTTQRTGILAPATGLTVYDLTTRNIWTFDGIQWKTIISPWNYTSSTSIAFGPFSNLDPVGNVYMGSNVSIDGRTNIGTSTAEVKLEVNTSLYSHVAKFNGPAPMYMSLFEDGNLRGYWGSYSGNAEDVDFGTGSGNSTGKLHLTIQASPKLTIDAFGKVGIGLTNPSTPLHVIAPSTFSHTLTSPFPVWNSQNAGTFVKSGSSSSTSVGVLGACTGTGSFFSPSLMIGIAGIANGGFDAYGVYGVASGGGSTNYGVYCSGNGGYTGTWSSLSDGKFKNNIAKLQEGTINKIMQLKPSSYTLKTEEYKFMNLPAGSQFGFVAQDLEQVFPTLVENSSHPGEEGVNGKSVAISYKSVNYIGLIPILTKAIQEQQTTIDDLKSEVELLRKEFSVLKASLRK